MSISRAQVVLNREPRTTDYQLRATYAEKKTSDYGRYPQYVKMWPLYTLTTLSGLGIIYLVSWAKISFVSPPATYSLKIIKTKINFGSLGR